MIFFQSSDCMPLGPSTDGLPYFEIYLLLEPETEHGTSFRISWSQQRKIAFHLTANINTRHIILVLHLSTKQNPIIFLISPLSIVQTTEGGKKCRSAPYAGKGKIKAPRYNNISQMKRKGLSGLSKGLNLLFQVCRRSVFSDDGDAKQNVCVWGPIMMAGGITKGQMHDVRGPVIRLL